MKDNIVKSILKVNNRLFRNSSKYFIKVIVFNVLFAIMVAFFEPLLFDYMFEEINNSSLELLVIIGVVATASLLFIVFLGYYNYVYIDLDLFKIVLKTDQQTLFDLPKVDKEHLDKFDQGEEFERVYSYGFDSVLVVTIWISLGTLVIFGFVLMSVLNLKSNYLLVLVLAGVIINLVKTLIDTKIRTKLVERSKGCDASLFDQGFNMIDDFDFYMMNDMVDRQLENNVGLEFEKFRNDLKIAVLDASNEVVSKVVNVGQTLVLSRMMFVDYLSSIIGVGSVFSYNTLMNKIDGTINEFIGTIKNVANISAGINRYNELMVVDEKLVDHNISHNNVKIEIKDLSLEKNGFNILKNINLVINDGDKVALVGHNGSGKSSLMKIIIGQEKGYTGSCLINGVEAREFGLGDKRNIAYVPSKHNLFDETVKDNILMGSNKLTVDSDICEEFIDKNINDISTGEGQRCNILRGVNDKRLITVADEPIANLDYGNKNKIIDLILKSANICIVSLHNEDFVGSFDHKIVLNKGEVVSE
ncbi:MAG: ABC transporter ATP-binding protein [Erysipelotrichaceae bacterium]